MLLGLMNLVLVTSPGFGQTFKDPNWYRHPTLLFNVKKSGCRVADISLRTERETDTPGIGSRQRTGTRILRSCAAFHFVFATGNIVTLLEFGKIR